MKFISPLLFFLVLVGCKQAGAISIKGRIDNELLSKLKTVDLQNAIIRVRSGGGDTEAGAKLGQYILDKNTSIIIARECISACAEFVMPAAESIRFENSPFVGFHWSPAMDFGQYKRAGANMDFCKFPAAKIQDNILNSRSLNPGFWMEIERRLDLEEFYFVKKTNENCPWKVRNFKNHLWLPSGQQLRELWGLKFEGKLCADNYQACKNKIDRRWKRGTRIIVGNVLHISNGR